MHDVLFRIPFLDVPVYGYGLLLVIGVFAASALAQWMSPKVGIPKDFFGNAVLVAVFSGIVGARLSHIVENLDTYTDPSRSAWDNFLAAINLTSGGLTFFGGLLFAIPITIGYGIWKKVPVKPGMDIAAAGITLGLAFGRVGCFLHGCCYGGVCEVPWAVQFPYGSPAYERHLEEGRIPAPPPILGDLQRTNLAAAEGIESRLHSLPVHPAQIYSSFNAFFLTAVLVAFFHYRHYAGRGFALMMILLGASRFVLETIRDEPARIGNFSFSMIVGSGLCLAGIALWFLIPYLGRRRQIVDVGHEPSVRQEEAGAEAVGGENQAVRVAPSE